MLFEPFTKQQGPEITLYKVPTDVAKGYKATRWLSWYGVGLASADRLPVVVRIPAGPLGSLKYDPPKGNGRPPKNKKKRCGQGLQGVATSDTMNFSLNQVVQLACQNLQ